MPLKSNVITEKEKNIEYARTLPATKDMNEIEEQYFHCSGKGSTSRCDACGFCFN